MKPPKMGRLPATVTDAPEEEDNVIADGEDTASESSEDGSEAGLPGTAVAEEGGASD